MTPNLAAPPDVARRLWLRIASDTNDPERVSADAERLCGQLSSGLGRWIGLQGYRALLARALSLSKVEHPALGSLHCLNGDEPASKIALYPHSADEVSAGMVALIAMLTDLLGKIIGEAMAVRLVEQAGMVSSPRGVVNAELRGGRDG